VSSITPYPGLRPFTEEEAIFFKGRDSHIRQIINQLEERKIVVVTGASGDGKSSIVYAGVIPNAKAGFFRAPYSNWLICDFRPERAPLENLSEAVAKNFDLEAETVKEELSYGFSSLINLYKQSKYSNTNNPNTESCANLLILADQFEEFFTNSENYSNGKASEDAYTAVNVLLETAKIALEENLPVYVIFTMRSDFISQSVAFKGLPETIGFSQFFVPRLKRHELQKVIEEPARLAGGKVAPRLTQTLINELPEGFDQLPLLQHSLNRLWQQADNGKQTIEFIHLAEIGGISREILQPEARGQFDEFYNLLDEQSKTYYENPQFTNILNSHANKLFDNAFSYIKKLSWIEQKPTKEDIQLILKTAFKSLTKIDQGRAVRNRAELIEITHVINQPHISYELVCAAINSFRLPDSTFVRPFIQSEDVETEILQSKAVLDITHEALIRNWEKLHHWGQEELSFLKDYEDLKVQLYRWKENDKDKTHLLGTGALAYFNNWYESAKPNPYWIAKNENWILSNEEKKAKATVIHEEIIEFLESSKKHLAAIEASKKRVRRILLIGALITIISLSGFTFWAMREKAFAQKQEQMVDKQRQIAEKEKENALNAQKLAEEQRRIAAENEQKAITAKQFSDIARKEAIDAKAIAEQQRNIAEQQSKLAQEQKQIALNQKEEAEKQTKIADEQRKKAIAASDSAQKLSYLALAQSLAYKAKKSYEDKQLNLLTAYQAYLFNKNYGGFEFDPTIFEGLRYAAELYNMQNATSLEKEEKVVSIKVLSNSKMLVLYNSGDLYELNSELKTSTQIKTINKKRVPLNAGFILNDSLLIYSYDDYSNYLNNINTKERYKINYHSNYLRAAEFIPTNNYLLTGARDKKLILAKILSKKLQKLQEFSLNDKIRSIDFSVKDEKAWIGLQNGEIYLYSIKDSTLAQIYKFDGVRVNSIKILSNQNHVLIGLSNGHLVFLNSKTLSIENDLFVSYSEIQIISATPDEKKIAIAMADNTIRIYQSEYLNEKPIIITGKYQKIQAMTMKRKGRLEALNSNNELRFYYLSPNDYAKYVYNKINRNFNNKEWKRIVGENVPYENSVTKEVLENRKENNVN